MTEFDRMFADQAISVLMDEFGEYITYHPTHAGNTGPRAIRAMVDRGPPEDAENNVLAPMVVIEVENHHTRGIDSTTLDTGVDAVELEMWPGQGQRRFQIKKRLPQGDNALLRLECG
jgi:hypothetical protein